MRSSAAPLLLSMMLTAAFAVSAASATTATTAASAAGAAAPQTPQPYPRPGTPPPSGQPARPSQPAPPAQPPPGGTAPAPPPQGPAAARDAAPTAATLGLPLPPGAQFISSYDAGQGQRYFLFGSASSWAEVVTFYRGALKQRGDVVFDEPATQIFEVGRFREETMAFPPSVVVKDYMWGNIGGYLNPKPGGQPARFPTIIQIVPIPASDRERER
jgi:hypothetical protein